MALGRLVSLACFGIFLLFIKDCDGLYSYQISSRDKGIGSAIGIFSLILSMVCCCCLCCRRNRNGKENVDTGEMYSNQENQQRIVTSTASAGVHYPLQPYTSNSTEDISPTQLYPYSGQLNTVFQYGIKAPDQSFGATSLPPYEEPAPSYESVFGVACPSFTTQENILNTQVPRL